MREKIYLSSPHMSGEEMKYIDQAFATNWIAPLGENVTQFENEMCKKIDAPYAVALSSGTAAIHLGLKYLGVGEGDIVFCSSFTFSGSCNPIIYLGATPVFIDCETDTWNMCPESLERAYKKYPNPKALIIVNLYGNPAKFDELLSVANAHNTSVLEDAAESLGSTYKGKHTGTFGDIGVFSFNGNKIITTSGGGMAVLKSQQAKDKLVFWATQSREKEAWYEHRELGYNYRLSNICAGIGRGQLSALDSRVERKGEIYRLYKKAFANNALISMIPEPHDTLCNHWLSAISLSKKSRVSFLDVIDLLSRHNIEARPAWKPMHMQPYFKKYDFFSVKEEGSICQAIFEKSLCLPSDTKLSDDQLYEIANIVNSAVK